MIRKAPVHRVLKKLGLSKHYIPQYMSHRIMNILFMLGVLVFLFFWVHTIPIIKAPGTAVGASLIYLDEAPYEAFAAKALDMGLDFMVITGADPNTKSLCAQDEKKYKIKCYFTNDTNVEGEPLSLCNSPSPGCDSIPLHQPWELERAAMTCSQLPPKDCVLRPMPMWHQTFIKVIAVAYLCISAIWILMGHKSLHEQVVEAGRNVIK